MDTIRSLGFDPHRLLLQADFSTLAPHDVFDAFTLPEQLTRWWPTRAEVDLRVGGAYHLEWPKMGWSLRGEYEQVQAPFRPTTEHSDVIPMAAYRSSDGGPRTAGGILSFTWAWDHEPDVPSRRVELRIDPFAGGTRMGLEHGTYGASDRDQAERASHDEGWRHFLPKLAELQID